MLRSLRLALFLSLSACAGNDAVGMGEEDIEEAPRDAGRRDAGRDASLLPTRDASAPTNRDASTPPRTDGSTPPLPNPFEPGDRTPSPNNPPECPDVAPDNPVGSCIGVPIYAVCSYTTYNCICDWYHWLCL